MLPGDDPLAVIGVFALAHELLEDRGFGLLGLQEQRVVPVATLEQEDPGPGPHAAHAHDLAGHVDELEVLEEVAAVALQGAAVAAHQPMERFH